MDTAAVSDLMRDAVGLVIKLGGPMLVLSMLVGVVVAIFQATQIHEQTIGFILKVAVIVAVLLLGGGWMLESLQEYTREIFALIAS